MSAIASTTMAGQIIHRYPDQENKLTSVKAKSITAMRAYRILNQPRVNNGVALSARMVAIASPGQ